jgi:hypothetical protein
VLPPDWPSSTRHLALKAQVAAASIDLARGANVRGGGCKTNPICRRKALRVTRVRDEIDRHITVEAVLILIAFDAVLGGRRLPLRPRCKTNPIYACAPAPAHRSETFIGLDRAGGHGTKALNVPDCVTRVPLRPRSPERDPAERGWLNLKERDPSHRPLENGKATSEACWHLIEQPSRLTSLTS